MTIPREHEKHIANLRKVADRLYAVMQREFDRPKTCDRDPAFPSRYHQMADQHAALRWALRELDPDYLPRTWPEIVHEVEAG